MKKLLAILFLLPAFVLSAEARRDRWGFQYEGQWQGNKIVGQGTIYDVRGLLLVQGDFTGKAWPEGYSDFPGDAVLLRDTVKMMGQFGLKCPAARIQPVAIKVYEKSGSMVKTVWFINYCGKAVGMFIDYRILNQGVDILFQTDKSKIADLLRAGY